MIAIKQAPSQVKKLGADIRRFPHCSTFLEIPYSKNKWQHGLKNQEEIDLVENFYGASFDNPQDNHIWADLSFSINHRIEPIGSMTNPEELLKVRIYQSTGSLTESTYIDRYDKADFILYNEDEEADLTMTLYEKRDLAVSNLVELKKKPQLCITVAKYLLPRHMRINTLAKAYTGLRDFIDGKIIKNKNEAVDEFMKAVDLDIATLKVTVDFEEAKMKNVIRRNKNNEWVNNLSGAVLGRTPKEVISYLLNPKNQSELGTGSSSDKSYSIRAQLKHLNNK